MLLAANNPAAFIATRHKIIIFTYTMTFLFIRISRNKKQSAITTVIYKLLHVLTVDPMKDFVGVQTVLALTNQGLVST